MVRSKERWDFETDLECTNAQEVEDGKRYSRIILGAFAWLVVDSNYVTKKTVVSESLDKMPNCSFSVLVTGLGQVIDESPLVLLTLASGWGQGIIGNITCPHQGWNSSG